MHSLNQRVATALVCLVALIAAGCGGSATVTPNFVNGGLNNPSRSSAMLLSRLASPITTLTAPPIFRAPTDACQTTATSITSLQYYIQSIQLCESVTINGTGYSGTEGCFYVYVNEDSQDVSYYNTYTVTEAMADTDPTHYIDFMDAESRKKLSQAGSIDSGTYNYALINFMRPIKIKAEFKDSSGTTQYRTKTTSSVIDGGSDDGGRQLEYARITGANSGSAELMTYMLNNGGTVIPFLEPFTVASGDNVMVDFIFNPANFASVTPSAPGGTSAAGGTSPNVTFDLPYAKMAPVARKTGETTMKEVYLLSNYATSGQASDYRIELYYNSADTEKKIRGVDTAVVYKSGNTAGAVNVIGSYGFSETGGVVTLKGWNPNTSTTDANHLTNLTRRTDGTVTLHCYFNGGPCSSTTGTETHTFNYTYEGVAEVSESEAI